MDHAAAPITRPTGEPERAGHALFAAWRDRTRLAALPGAYPETLDQAYAVQSVIAAAVGPVGGWKVSPIRAGGEPRCSPIPQRFFSVTPTAFDAPFLDSCLGELEIAIRLGADLSPLSSAVSAGEVAATIASVHPAVELLSTRFSADSTAPDLHRLADLQNCAGVVIGAGMADWRGLEFSGLALELALDGQGHRSVQAQPSTGETLAAIGWLADHAQRRGRPLRAGDVIITGARVGPFALANSRTITGRVASLGDVTISRR